MAASTEEKDFIHIVLRSLPRKAGAAPEAMIRNIANAILEAIHKPQATTSK